MMHDPYVEIPNKMTFHRFNIFCQIYSLFLKFRAWYLYTTIPCISHK